jgi:hypothetical protein
LGVPREFSRGGRLRASLSGQLSQIDRYQDRTFQSRKCHPLSTFARRRASCIRERTACSACSLRSGERCCDSSPARELGERLWPFICFQAKSNYESWPEARVPTDPPVRSHQSDVIARRHRPVSKKDTMCCQLLSLRVIGNVPKANGYNCRRSIDSRSPLAADFRLA